MAKSLHMQAEIVLHALMPAVLPYETFLLLLSAPRKHTAAFDLSLLLPTLTPSALISSKTPSLHPFQNIYPHVFLLTAILRFSALL